MEHYAVTFRSWVQIPPAARSNSLISDFANGLVSPLNLNNGEYGFFSRTPRRPVRSIVRYGSSFAMSNRIGRYKMHPLVALQNPATLYPYREKVPLVPTGTPTMGHGWQPRLNLERDPQVYCLRPFGRQVPAGYRLRHQKDNAANTRLRHLRGLSCICLRKLRSCSVS